MWLVFGVACGKNTSKADVEAFRTTQRAALERLQRLQREFDSALAELQDGKWVPRPDLGVCAASLPTPPSETDRASTFPAFFLDDQDPLGWSGLSQRVFNEPRLAIGNPDGWLPDANSIAAETKKIADSVPFKSDVMVLHVDEAVRPNEVGGERFESGSERGRAWIWSSTTHEIICAGEFVGVTPAKVTATISERKDPTADVNATLILAQRRASVRSAVEKLVAAGPPKPP